LFSSPCSFSGLQSRQLFSQAALPAPIAKPIDW
jgi:hypothetical protein